MKTRAAALVIVAACGLLAESAAQAKTITIGSPGPASDNTVVIGIVGTLVNFELPGARVTAPRNGVITSWKIARAEGGPFRLQVVHPSGDGFWTSPRSTGPASVSVGPVTTFRANLPVRKGDYIGLLPTAASDRVGGDAPPHANLMTFTPPLGPDPMSPTTTGPGEFGFNAQMTLDCVVPKLRGKRVRAAKKALKKAGCAPPKIKNKKGSKVVRKQKPKAGKRIRGDSAVTLTLGPKRK